MVCRIIASNIIEIRTCYNYKISNKMGFYMNYPTLETKRLILKMPSLDDAQAMQELLNDKRVSSKLASVSYPYHLDDAKNFIQKARDRFFGEDAKHEFGLFLKSSGQFIGMCGLAISTKNNHGTLGYWLGYEYWSKGYMTEAVKEIVRYAFEEINLHRVASHHFASNPNSGKVLEKVGLKREGIRKEHFKKVDTYLDICDYGMLRDEFLA